MVTSLDGFNGRSIETLLAKYSAEIRLALEENRQACITCALLAKQGERGILREAREERESRDEGMRKKQLSACYQSIVLALPTFTTRMSSSNWSIDEALF